MVGIGENKIVLFYHAVSVHEEEAVIGVIGVCRNLRETKTTPNVDNFKRYFEKKYITAILATSTSEGGKWGWSHFRFEGL